MLDHLARAFPSAKGIHICEITLQNYTSIISDAIKKASGSSLVFLNLCDGIETDGYPGISIVDYLEAQKLAFTGAGSTFYINSTSKTLLKNVCFLSLHCDGLATRNTLDTSKA